MSSPGESSGSPASRSRNSSEAASTTTSIASKDSASSNLSKASSTGTGNDGASLQGIPIPQVPKPIAKEARYLINFKAKNGKKDMAIVVTVGQKSHSAGDKPRSLRTAQSY